MNYRRQKKATSTTPQRASGETSDGRAALEIAETLTKTKRRFVAEGGRWTTIYDREKEKGSGSACKREGTIDYAHPPSA